MQRREPQAAAASGSGVNARGHDRRLFVGAVEEELLCGLCGGVLNGPVVACAAGHMCAARVRRQRGAGAQRGVCLP
jgi:hypothetical protein